MPQDEANPQYKFWVGCWLGGWKGEKILSVAFKASKKFGVGFFLGP